MADRKIERVAALIGKRVGDDYVVLDVLPARNEDQDPENKFFVSNQQLDRLILRAQKKGYLLLGIAHSHPAHHPELPSLADMHHCRHAVNAVYHPSTRSLTWFNNQGELNRQAVSTFGIFPILNRIHLSV